MHSQTHDPSHVTRIALIAILAWLLSAGLVLAGQPATQPIAAAVTRIGNTVEDLDRSVAWYTTVLDFRKVHETEVVGDDVERQTGVFGARCRIARLRLGDEELELTEYLTPKGRDIPRDSRSNDRWFQHIAIIVSDIDQAYAKLREHKVRHASTGPQTLPAWNANAAGIRPFYFHDPDGHVLEILQFPSGKGDPRWRALAKETTAAKSPFLGIDHTAIVVGNTDQSLKFYRDRLGMKVVGTSENYGVEQERLNNVFGARLRITTLATAAGPKIELLEYLAPRGGRTYPLDSASNDLWHWQTSLTTPDAQVARQTLRDGRLPLVSSTMATAPFVCRDPDGHALKFHTAPSAR